MLEGRRHVREQWVVAGKAYILEEVVMRPNVRSRLRKCMCAPPFDSYGKRFLRRKPYTVISALAQISVTTCISLTFDLAARQLSQAFEVLVDIMI